QENFAVIQQAFAGGDVRHDGKYVKIERFPVRMRTMQQPHPPLWYATLKPDSAAWAARAGANVMTLGSIEVARAVSARYRGEWAAAGRDLQALPHLGITRHVAVADTDAEARALGRRAYRPWRTAMELLWKEAGTKFTVAAVYP